MFRFFLALFCVLFGALVSCQQTPPYPVFFLTESGSGQQNAAFTLAYKGHYYDRLPILALKHCARYRSFLNTEDGSYGVTLYLKEEYRNRLYFTTQEHLGRRILPIVNGLAFQPLLIDAPITDGKLVIWGGLNGYDLMRMADTLEPMEPEMEKKRFLKKNPREIPMQMRSKRGKLRDTHGRPIQELESAH